MDRILKVYTLTGHLFAEFTFNYDAPRQVNARYTLYRRLYNGDEEDESKSVYPLYDRDFYLEYREFSSVEEIKAYDKDLVKRNAGMEMTDPADTYRYEYPVDKILIRYVAANHLGTIGILDFRLSFIENFKEMKYFSAEHPRFDFDLLADSLETNISCIGKIPLYRNGELYEISYHDLKRLDTWY